MIRRPRPAAPTGSLARAEGRTDTGGVEPRGVHDARAIAGSVRFGAERVDYLLVRRPRRSIGFVVGARGLTVHAPARIGAAALEAALRSKSGWILARLAEHRERAARAAAEPLPWRDGGRLRVLGDAVTLRLDPALRVAVLVPAARPEASDGPAAAATTATAPPARELRLPLPTDASPARIEAAAGRWLRGEAARIFAERIEVFAPRVGAHPTRLQLSSARTRWGSASTDGSIRLNLRLVHLPRALVDYVVVHELAHLREMNHGPRFWAIVTEVLPEHPALRRALKDVPLAAPGRQSEADPADPAGPDRLRAGPGSIPQAPSP